MPDPTEEKPSPLSEPVGNGVRVFGRQVDRWALNFGVGSAFALIMLVAAIYFIKRLADAQDSVAVATVKMETLISLSSTSDAERERRAEAHYAEATRQYTEAARRESDAIQRSETLVLAIQSLIDSNHPKPNP